MHRRRAMAGSSSCRKCSDCRGHQVNLGPCRQAHAGSTTSGRWADSKARPEGLCAMQLASQEPGHGPGPARRRVAKLEVLSWHTDPARAKDQHLLLSHGL